MIETQIWRTYISQRRSLNVPISQLDQFDQHQIKLISEYIVVVLEFPSWALVREVDENLVNKPPE